MRGRLINWGCVGPGLAYLAAALGIVVGAISLEQHGARPVSPAANKLNVVAHRDLMDELARCQALGRRAEDDFRCTEAWLENRKRFFGTAPQPASSSKSERMLHP